MRPALPDSPGTTASSGSAAVVAPPFYTSPGLTVLCLSPGGVSGGKPRDGGGIGEGRFIFLISALTKGEPCLSLWFVGSLPRLRAALGGKGAIIRTLPALPPALATTPILTVNLPAGVGALGTVGERGGD